MQYTDVTWSGTTGKTLVWNVKYEKIARKP